MLPSSSLPTSDTCQLFLLVGLTTLNVSSWRTTYHAFLYIEDCNLSRNAWLDFERCGIYRHESRRVEGKGGRAVPAPAGANFEASGYDPDVRVNRDVQLQRRSRMPRQAPSTLFAATSHEILYLER